MAHDDEDGENLSAKTKRVQSQADKDRCRKARERYRKASDYWGPKYDLSREDKRFFAGNSENMYQWPSEAVNSRGNERPKLTINRLPQFHNQIVNDYRQSTIGVKAAPQGAEDKKVAMMYKGLFRQIEKQSYAQVAYINALSDGAIGGLGWLRVLPDYARPDSFDQDLFIRRIVNPSRVLPDPNAQGFFLEDGQYLFFLESIPLEEYEDEYPNSDPEDFVQDDYINDWRQDGEQGKKVVVAEYFYYVKRKRELWQFEDGTSIFKDEIHADKLADAEKAKVKGRTVDAKELHWCKMNGYEILEETVWPKPRIPFIPIWGNELWVDDDRQFEGQVRSVKDSQRMYNYMQSTKTEMIALAPKAPYIAAEGQLEGREQEWRDAATTPKSVLYYRPLTVDGLVVPPPQRQSYEAPVAAIIQASMQASDDMKATLGVYDASLGARGNEVSGRAINARKQEGDTATYNYVDNLSMGIGYMATVIAELIPVYYDTKRQIRIVTDDNRLQTVEINGESEDSPNIVDVQYDLVLDTGPSFSTQRQESVAIITDLSQNFPKIMEVAGDIAVRNMDFKGSDEIADRLKRTLPPQVVGEEADPVTKLAAAQNELQMAKQAIEELSVKSKEDDTKLAEQSVQLKNKAGELRIKQQELSLKRIELNMQAENEGRDKEGETADESAVLDAIAELAAQVTELTEMVEAVVEEETAPTEVTEVVPPVTPSTPTA